MVAVVTSFRVKALRRALAASLFVPLVAGALFLAQLSGIALPDARWVGFVLLALSAVPTTAFLLTAAMGHPWTHLERDWNGLSGWQRLVSSSVALLCGLTTGAAVVLIILSVVELDARATEEPEPPAKAATRS